MANVFGTPCRIVLRVSGGQTWGTRGRGRDRRESPSARHTWNPTLFSFSGDRRFPKWGGKEKEKKRKRLFLSLLLLGPDRPPPRSEGGLTIINALLTLLHGQFGKLFLAQIFGEMELSLAAARIKKEEREKRFGIQSTFYPTSLRRRQSKRCYCFSPLFSPFWCQIRKNIHKK